jgi:putative tryptophan/tyrosine transport system substrate-binding protein
LRYVATMSALPPKADIVFRIPITGSHRQNENDRLPALATELVNHHVQVIAATGTSASWMAVKAATAKTPIVLQGGGDPVKLRLVASFNRPGGNVTGVINVSGELTAKWLQVLREL